jgi:hypothetical protein
MKVWRYVIVNDYGSAPNYGPPRVTLATCKPRIRKAAQPGDLLIAFAGKPIDPNPDKVVWVGAVSEKLTFEEYWKEPRFQRKKPKWTARPDNIYRPIRGRLQQVQNDIHGPFDAERDTRGEFVLVFEPAWHLQLDASALPTHFSSLRLDASNRRGERRGEVPDGIAREFLDWARARALPRERAQRRQEGRPKKREPVCLRFEKVTCRLTPRKRSS